MDWVFGLVSEFALWGSLALLAWGAALCLEEAGAAMKQGTQPLPGPRPHMPTDVELPPFVGATHRTMQ